MMPALFKYLPVFFLLAFSINGFSQYIHFKRLNTSAGLSDNRVNKAMLDKNGMLWIATTEGLNSFDGYAVYNWNTQVTKGLGSKNIRDLYCDNENNIWIHNPEGNAGWLDRRRIFRNVVLPDSIKNGKVQYFLFHPKRGMMLLSGNFLLHRQHPGNRFVVTAGIPPELYQGNLVQYVYDSSGNFCIATPNRVLYVEGSTFSSRSVIEMEGITGLASPSRGKLLLSTSANSKLLLLDAANGRILKDLTSMKDQRGQMVKGYFRKMTVLADGNIGLASTYGGYYVLNAKMDQLTSYGYEPLDENSLSNNSPTSVFADRSGNVFITSRESGLTMYNIYRKGAQTRRFFQDGQTGFISGGFLSHIVKDKMGNLWSGTQNGLLRWNPASNDSKLFDIKDKTGRLVLENETVTGLCMDDNGRLWVGTSQSGIVVLNLDLKPVKYLESSDGSLVYNGITGMVKGPDGNIWVSTERGLSIINPLDWKDHKNQYYPGLQIIPHSYIFSVWQRTDSELWIGTDSGAYRFDTRKGMLRHYSTRDGLLQNRVSYFGGDSSGNIYMCSRNGFYLVAPNDKIEFFGSSNGLPNDICLGVETDHHNNVWISNDNYLIRFSPSDKKIKVFNNRSGISQEGFRYGHLQDKSGMMYWCCNDGLTYFNPDDLGNDAVEPNVLIHSVTTQGAQYFFTGNDKVELNAGENDLQFTINPIDILGAQPLQYEYKLEGTDEGWQKGYLNQRTIAYQNLPPNNYVLHVRVSADGKDWSAASNAVVIKIRPSWYQNGWVRLTGVLLLIGILGWFWRNVRDKRATELALTNLKRKAAEVEMQALRAQMNPHFMFNSLNSINNFILNSDIDNASAYLTRFSRLMRLILDNSRNDWVPLEQEIHALELYIGMESLRFDHAFSWQINIGEGVDMESVQIPPLLMQPYVENAIWHGLMHRKVPGGHLQVSLDKKDDMLVIEIEDNGVGREAAAKLKYQMSGHKKSHGMDITSERIAMINRVYGADVGMEIQDKKNENNLPEGTLVQLRMRYTLQHQFRG